MQLEALYEKIDELIAFEPRWYIWSEVEKQIFKNLPLLQEYESELRDFLEKVNHDIQFLEVQDRMLLVGFKKLEDIERKMKKMEKMKKYFKYSGKNI
jgi:hypothetical protein